MLVSFIIRLVCSLLFLAWAPIPVHAAQIMGGVTIVGNGPERPMIDDLARTFEKANPAAYVDIIWNKHAKTVAMVRGGQADLAVAGRTDPNLRATHIGWDGIAIMVQVSNSTNEVTLQQIADVFSGKVKYWSDLGGPDKRITIINRHRTQHLTDSFERTLGIVNQIPKDARVIGPEQKATNTVVGTLSPNSAVTYMSLRPALAAVNTGVAVRLLPIDQVEPEYPTVKDGRYPIRRPVLLLSRQEVNATVQGFLDFVLSPKGQDIVDGSYTSLDRKKPTP